ncbi:ThiF family adenylyltransferase [Roseofilum sp. BLCC_M154]|uniref:ThiF family adenylyltransferase n=1 Tax=Roseofilum acuticapitatum BLCC-M154 TaxID=3022444 RepID=A0ABT7ASE7_9CYAN|nr:ThiF family adenylyltransferase [Roseofilum acuticapitatum]MDJ1169831.1 ThiF family adenylyltransferase [Roseofilum acuticapitatum BLCC-M154]
MSIPEDKYKRLKLIPNWSQEKLAQAKVAVFGCGALGNEVLKNLALLGVGHIWVVDYDTIEIHNLTRSVLFRESDIGRHKAEVVAERVKELNPDTQVYSILGKLEFAFGRGLLREMDVCFGCVDSFGARRTLNERSYFAGTPWIDGGIDYAMGNVAFFNPRVPETACYRCKMNSTHWEQINERRSCPDGYLKDDYKEPVIATSIMTSSVIAAYQVEIAVQVILGEQKFQPGTQLFLPVSFPMGFKVGKFKLNEECPDHELINDCKNFSPHSASLDNTASQVAAMLGLNDQWELQLPFDFVFKLTCPQCGHIELIAMPVQEVKYSQSWCPKCNYDYRTPTKNFKIYKDSEEAGFPLRYFWMADKEIVQFKQNGQLTFVELTDQTLN